MNMRIFYVCVMVLLFSPMSAFAQDDSPGDGRQPPGTADIVAKMQSKLNLTQDQVTAVTPIIDKYSSKREELRQSIQDGGADRSSIRGRMKQLKTDESQELSQVLSAGQLSQWNSAQGGRHKHSKDEGNGGGDGEGNGNSGGN